MNEVLTECVDKPQHPTLTETRRYQCVCVWGGVSIGVISYAQLEQWNSTLKLFVRWIYNDNSDLCVVHVVYFFLLHRVSNRQTARATELW